jgi:BirA family biotin operon repressor/biotin-[acetyl-CoA-carboxylase] ligase
MDEQAPLRRRADHGDSSAGWGCQALWDAMSPLLPGLAVEVVARTSSTNSEVIDRLRNAVRGSEGRGSRAEDVQPSMLIAVHQTQGRGRLGRVWHADPLTSLTFTLAVPLNRTDWSGLSLAVGVAVALAVDPIGQHIRLKWPNDLWVPDGTGSGRKLGGVLIEAMAVGQQRMAVVGVGLNVLPQQHMAAVASVSEFDPQATPPSVLGAIGPVLAQALVDFDREGFAAFASEFTQRDLLIGANVLTSDATCPEGLALGVAADGALRVMHDGLEHRIVSGEVSVRPAPRAAS